MVAGLRHGDAHREGTPAVRGGRVAQQLERVERAVLGVPAVGLVALPGRDREHVGSDTRRDPHGRPQRAVRRLEQQDVAVFHLPLRRRLGVHFDPGVPGDLRDRVGQLLQPWLVRAAAVVQGDGGTYEQQRLVGRGFPSEGRHVAGEREAHRLHRRLGEQAAVLQGVIPEFVEPPCPSEATVQLLPAALQVVLERPRLPRQP